MKETLELWRDEVKRHGFKDIYAVCCQTFGLKDPNEYGFDAAAEFPPHTIKSSDITDRLRVLNPSYKGHIYSYDEVVENATRETEPEFKLFRTAMLSWDNTARKQDQSHVFHGFSLVRYKQWLSTLCNNVFHNKKYAEEEKIVFINAWNEWAEGTHLEPDRKYGYGYLQATYDVISNYDSVSEIEFGLSNVARSSNYAVVIHAHYQDVLINLLDRLKNLNSFKFDLYVTSSDANLLRLVKEEFPLANLHLVENRGRDILPFIEVLRIIENMGYSAVCKLHTKKSVYRADGDLICDRLFSGLIGDVAHVESIVRTFNSNSSVGMVASATSLVPHSDHNMTYDNEVVGFVSKRCGVEFEYSNFPAGSMFWFRPEALLPLLALVKQDFPVELGLADGTLAHGVERMFTRLVVSSGFQVVAV
jgi:lipopolysaccharide biosynthesis protein